jgi:site-specific DNA recombinase
VHDGLIDPADEDDEFFSYMRGWIGRREQTQKIKRLRERFQERRDEGMPLWGNRPFGFELDRLTHREDEAAELRWAYDRILAGASIYSIIKSWNERGIETSANRDRREKRERGEEVAWDIRNKKRREKGEPEVKEPIGWSYATVQQMLKRPRNAGLMEVGGEILYDHPVKWERIVDLDSWNEVRGLLSDSSRAGSVNREARWLCSALARCGVCGDVMRSGRGSDRHGSTTVYRCTRKQRTAISDGQRHTAVKTKDLDPLVRGAVISTFLLGPTSAMPSEAASVAEVRRIQARLREVRDGLRDVNELVGTPGFRPALMKKRAAELSGEETALAAQLEEHARSSAHAAKIVESRAALFRGKGEGVSLANAARLKAELSERFDALPLEQQRTLVRSLLEITVYPGRSPDRIDIRNLAEPSLGSTAV